MINYEHTNHKWEILRSAHDNYHLICNKCNTVTTISDLLENTEAATENKTKLSLLAEQLYAGDLKKRAHDIAYYYVRSFGPESVIDKYEQEKLL